MCILFLAVNQHPQYPLIVCANRDEFRQRPTQGAHYWESCPTILAGKDLQAGGTWLGVTHTGQFAAVTNIRQPGSVAEHKSSRGELVTRALLPFSEEVNTSSDLSCKSTKQSLDKTVRSERNQYGVNDEWLKNNSDNYGPFNLVYGNSDQLFCYNSIAKEQQQLSVGFHAISNGALDDIWPKMRKGVSQLKELVLSENSPTEIIELRLISLLQDQNQADDHELPDTGIPKNWEKRLSSIFIKGIEYGTRSSSIITVSKLGELTFNEWEYDQNSETLATSSFRFQID